MLKIHTRLIQNKTTQTHEARVGDHKDISSSDEEDRLWSGSIWVCIMFMTVQWTSPRHVINIVPNNMQSTSAPAVQLLCTIVNPDIAFASYGGQSHSVPFRWIGSKTRLQFSYSRTFMYHLINLFSHVLLIMKEKKSRNVCRAIFCMACCLQDLSVRGDT